MSFIIAISRYLLPFLTIVILTKCVLALLLGHPKEKIYGYIIDLADGESYPLNMWETSIGRSNSCDIVIGYNTVSRFHAVISRRIDGWYIYDLLSKTGIKINGEDVKNKATVKSGDILTFGLMQYRFMVADDPVQRAGKKKGKRRDGNAPKYTRVNVKGQMPDDDRSGGASYEKDRAYTDRGDPYYNKDSFNVETPGRTDSYGQYSYTVSRPKLINCDTDEVFVLCGTFVTVGRSNTCDISLRSPSVSRHHANVVLYEDGWAIEDSGSANGTYLNKNKVTEPQLLFEGDVIAIGDERLYFTVDRKSLR